MPITIFDIVLFQLTASQGGWRLWSFTMDYKCKNFNSQPHKEADGAQGMSGLLAIVFQLTASQGGWLSHAYQQTFANTFQLTASQGGWRLFLLLFSPAYRISTHSLTRRLTYGRKEDFDTYCISTHSLTRRLTHVNYTAKTSIRISTHSLTRRLTMIKMIWNISIVFQLTASQGGWRTFDSVGKSLTNFNSQPHKEADLYGRYEPINGLYISTHSLTRRLTKLTDEQYNELIFQLTASQGGWLVTFSFPYAWICYFNSQPHKEADTKQIPCIYN